MGFIYTLLNLQNSVEWYNIYRTQENVVEAIKCRQGFIYRNIISDNSGKYS